MDGLLMIAMNKHREICSIQSSGGIMLLKEQVNATGDPVFFCKTDKCEKVTGQIDPFWHYRL